MMAKVDVTWSIKDMKESCPWLQRDMNLSWHEKKMVAQSHFQGFSSRS